MLVCLLAYLFSFFVVIVFLITENYLYKFAFCRLKEFSVTI